MRRGGGRDPDDFEKGVPRDPDDFEKGVPRDPDDFEKGVGLFFLKNQVIETTLMGHICPDRRLIDP